MRRGFLLVTLFLVVKLRCSQSRCEEPGSRRSTSDVGAFFLFVCLFLVRADQDNDIHRLFLTTAADSWFGQPQAQHSEEV